MKLNAFLKEKNIRFYLQRNKRKIVELVKNNSVPTREIRISSLLDI